MSKNYNPEMPSTGYDVADLAALKASNLMPALKEDRLCRFDSTDDASIFFARELDYIHDNPMAERLSKMLGQAMFEAKIGSREEFRKRYGRSYL